MSAPGLWIGFMLETVSLSSRAAYTIDTRVDALARDTKQRAVAHYIGAMVMPCVPGASRRSQRNGALRVAILRQEETLTTILYYRVPCPALDFEYRALIDGWSVIPGIIIPLGTGVE